MYKRKSFYFILILFVSLVIELVPFNFSAWKSLFYKDRLTFENTDIDGVSETYPESGEYIAVSDDPTLHILNIDNEVRNLFLDIEPVSDTILRYTVSLTDEGNHYPYSLPEQTIVSGLKKSHYTDIYSSGKVTNIDIRLSLAEGDSFIMNKICANAHIPFMFSPIRWLAVLLTLFLIYLPRLLSGQLFQTSSPKGSGDTIFTADKNNSDNNLDKKTNKLNTTGGSIALSSHSLKFTVLTIMLLIGFSWMLVHVNPVCITSPWPHHKQYQELAESLSKWKLYLDAKPSEGLLSAPNPYDTIYLQANGIEYMADYAYHDGKYYVYFGVVPELLLYLPFYLLTGHALPNYLAVFLFYGIFIIAVFALYHEIIKKWFDKTPYPLYLLICILTICCGNYLFIIARPDIYDVPIMAAHMFTTLGLWFWLKGQAALTAFKKRSLYFAGSLCMALVAGCRPQMLLFSVLFIPLFSEELKNLVRQASHSIRKLLNKGAVRIDSFGQSRSFPNHSRADMFFLTAPYIMVAAGLMYYNAARFGSVFDFGATYSLTSNDMTRRGFNLHQTLLGLWHYFLRPPVIESDFPYLTGIQITSSSYMGKLNAEYTYGGLIACNAFTWILLFIGKTKDVLKEKGIYVFALINLCSSVIICVVDVNGAGILQRYLTDILPGIWLASVMSWLALAQRAIEKNMLRPLIKMLTIVFLIQIFYGFGVIFGNGDLSVNVRTSNPELYYYLRTLLRF